MDTDTKYRERQELIEIYNNLSLPFKKQLLTLVRVMDGTREIILQEGKTGKHSKLQKGKI
ncbi:MAG: hypothetical protein HFG18_01950 [Oscillospiraceae bacterium]|nr:hypothetical protein [Oscillospiraceae bacterium]MCI9363814.1 hypothetical protein [Oscillospiraceae bacterium]MCI9668913.1 hypothetical protein [Oscillospiraceae bacterium]